MKYKGFSFLWYDFWIGFFYDQKKRILYVCPMPCCVFKFEAVEQSVQRTADNVATCPHGIPENMACRLCGD